METHWGVGGKECYDLSFLLKRTILAVVLKIGFGRERAEAV